MPHVTDDTDILEQISHPATYDNTHEFVRVLPSYRRRRSPLFLALYGWLMPRLRLPAQRAQIGTRLQPQMPEVSIDLLARKYPDIYRRITSWSI